MAHQLNSWDVPQADRLADVVRAAEAVASGKTGFDDIARSIDKGERQGRYYRHATELLGLTRRIEPNESAVTERGQQLAALGRGEERRLSLARWALDIAAIRYAFDVIASQYGCTPASVAASLHAAGLNLRTAERRVHTLLSWLEDLRMIERRDGLLYALWRPSPETPEAEILDEPETEPAAPAPSVLGMPPVFRLPRPAPAALQYEVDLVARERANRAHAELVRAMADELRASGSTPYSSPLLDLYAERHSISFVFEMKSCTSRNLHRQVRQGVAQLLEYSYRYKLRSPVLCLVLESEPTGRNAWLIDYVGSLGITTCWPAHEGGFEFSNLRRDDLAVLLRRPSEPEQTEKLSRQGDEERRTGGK